VLSLSLSTESITQAAQIYAHTIARVPSPWLASCTGQAPWERRRDSTQQVKLLMPALAPGGDHEPYRAPSLPDAIDPEG
jgi:hypothetical protein